jgi:hypothetical protein
MTRRQLNEGERRAITARIYREAVMAEGKRLADKARDFSDIEDAVDQWLRGLETMSDEQVVSTPPYEGITPKQLKALRRNLINRDILKDRIVLGMKLDFLGLR